MSAAVMVPGQLELFFPAAVSCPCDPRPVRGCGHCRTCDTCQDCRSCSAPGCICPDCGQCTGCDMCVCREGL